jgi:hypothetical protein
MSKQHRDSPCPCEDFCWSGFTFSLGDSIEAGGKGGRRPGQLLETNPTKSTLRISRAKPHWFGRAGHLGAKGARPRHEKALDLLFQAQHRWRLSS